MSGKASRNRGNNSERSEAKVFRDLGFKNACTSRAESRTRDALKIDLCETGKFNVQIKNSQNNPNYHEILNQMPDEPGKINLVCHYKTQKSAKGKFMLKDKYYTLKAEDMYEIIKLLIEGDPVNTLFGPEKNENL